MEGKTSKESSKDQRGLCVGMGVLARGTDSLFLVGNIQKVDEKKEKCYIAFENDEEMWCPFKHIQNAGSTGGRDITCCLCREGNSIKPNQIVLCDMCGMGFHQRCHYPRINDKVLEPEVEWACRLCKPPTLKSQANQTKSSHEKSKKKSVGQNDKGQVVPISPEKPNHSQKSSESCNSAESAALVYRDHMYNVLEVPHKVLPYDFDSLSWDKFHLTNATQQYCYCGKSGRWYTGMLQCRRCLQWFHEDCVQVLDEPMVWGDQFFIFCCALCNSKKEYLRRLDIGWAEVIHLTLFMLAMEQHMKYFDIHEFILPWIRKNLSRFRLPKKLRDEEEAVIRSHVLAALNANNTLYKSGREVKKRLTWWGLRDRYPPIPLRITELPSGPITEKMVDSVIAKGKSLPKLSVTDSYPEVAFQLIRKRKATNDGDIIAERPPKKKTKISNGAKNSSKVNSSHNQEYSGYPGQGNNYVLPVDALKQAAKNNNNNDSPEKISLDHIIPHPTNFDGFNHPFKTILERNQEIAHTKLKERILGSFTVCDDLAVTENGIEESVSDSCVELETASDSTSLSQPESTVSEPAPNKTNRLKIHSLFPKMKRRKRGRPSKAEIQALEARYAAAIKMGIVGKNCIVQRKSPANSVPTTPKHGEKRPRAKNVVDKSTLDSMSEREVSMNQLRSSVNNYFGAANRLATGEGFRVLAKRISPDGRVQYLVEWEGGIIG